MASLLFVYNAKSDYWSKKLDFAHKIISPTTYNCNLCALTHGNFGETEIWKDFRENSKIDMKFIHKDQFQKEYPQIEAIFPIIFKKEDTELSVFMNAATLSQINSVDDLVSTVTLQF